MEQVVDKQWWSLFIFVALRQQRLDTLTVIISVCKCSGSLQKKFIVPVKNREISNDHNQSFTRTDDAFCTLHCLKFHWRDILDGKMFSYNNVYVKYKTEKNIF